MKQFLFIISIIAIVNGGVRIISCVVFGVYFLFHGGRIDAAENIFKNGIEYLFMGAVCLWMIDSYKEDKTEQK